MIASQVQIQEFLGHPATEVSREDKESQEQLQYFKVHWIRYQNQFDLLNKSEILESIISLIGINAFSIR